MGVVIEPGNLPIPARPSELELGIAKLARTAASFLAGKRNVGDDGA